MPWATNPLAPTKAGYAFTDRCNLADDLMARDDRPRVMEVALLQEGVTAADTTGKDFDENFPGTGASEG